VTARVLDPAAVAASIRAELRAEVARLASPLTLVGFLADEAGPSATYAAYTRRGCEDVGIRFELRHVLRQHLHRPWLYRFVMLVLSAPLLPFMLIEKLFWRIESSWSWWITAYALGRWLIYRRKFDLIYSTGGAYAAHIAGAALQRATGVPWMAEVHDPMVVPGVVPSTPQQRKQAQVEALICAQADVAIWFTEQALATARHDAAKENWPQHLAPLHVFHPCCPNGKLDTRGEWMWIRKHSFFVPFLLPPFLCHAFLCVISVQDGENGKGG
jgi:hypothetical protein